LFAARGLLEVGLQPDPLRAQLCGLPGRSLALRERPGRELPLLFELLRGRLALRALGREVERRRRPRVMAARVLVRQGLDLRRELRLLLREGGGLEAQLDDLLGPGGVRLAPGFEDAVVLPQSREK